MILALFLHSIHFLFILLFILFNEAHQQPSRKRSQPQQKKINTFFQPAKKRPLHEVDGAEFDEGGDIGGVSCSPDGGPSSSSADVMDMDSEQGSGDIENGTSTAPANSPPVLSPSEQTDIVRNDIGQYIGKHIDDYTKCQLIENRWMPNPGFTFPFSVHNKGTRRRYLNDHHLKNPKYKWLVYSPSLKGLFCKYCPWFVTGAAGGMNKTIKLKYLVTEPLRNYKDLIGKDGDLELHSKNNYHVQAEQAAMDFLRTYYSPEADVASLVNQQRLNEIKENRERLKPIVKTIIFCGRNNLPLRGHRDDGMIKVGADSHHSQQEGVFRNLLRFRVDAGDTVLEKHLETTSARATYISKTSQNKLIQCSGKEISDQIVGNVMNALFYIIMFDETTDISHASQISLILRYVHKGNIREDFVCYVNAFQDLATVKEDEEYDSDDDLI